MPWHMDTGGYLLAVSPISFTSFMKRNGITDAGTQPWWETMTGVPSATDLPER